MLSSFHCLIVVCQWSPVLCLQSFGEMLDIKENDKGSPKRLSLLLFMWKVVVSAIGKVIFSSRGTQISHSGFHKPYREAQSGVNQRWAREGMCWHTQSVWSSFSCWSTLHCYNRTVRVPVGFIVLLKFSAMHGRGALLFETCIVSCEIRLKKSYGGRNMK